jgi:hypothetical protein
MSQTIAVRQQRSVSTPRRVALVTPTDLSNEYSTTMQTSWSRRTCSRSCGRTIRCLRDDYEKPTTSVRSIAILQLRASSKAGSTKPNGNLE